MFESKEKKALKKAQKEQAITEALMQQYGLSEVDVKDKEMLLKVVNSLRSMGLMKAGIALSFGKAADQVTIGYLSALVEQNFIIIRQLDKIRKSLEEKK
jgi:DNA-directed RNA polymerase specialized sigma54-like protein